METPNMAPVMGLTFEESPLAVSNLLSPAALEKSTAGSNLFTSVGDSWTDTFVQRSEASLSAQFNQPVQGQPIQDQSVQDQTFQIEDQHDEIDPITGTLTQLKTERSAPYPGYLLRYTPGTALENRPAVAQWQAQMQRRGWTIQVDGLYGAQSERVARQFQLEKGLRADGIVGPETWRVAFDESTITGAANELDVVNPQLPRPYSGRFFSYSPSSALRYDAEVQAFQQRLQDLNWRIDADGLFGPRSANVTRAFQRQVGLTPDGIVGALTWAAVFSEDAPTAPVEPTFISPGSIRPINETGLNLIREFEGRRLSAYQDAVGVWTVGYGHTRTAYPGQRITEAEATALLREDVATFERAVSRAVRVPLTDNQYAALVSFAFNVGSGALNSSTLLRRLNSGDYDGAANELLRWNRAGGQVLYGLTRRREAERSLFFS